MSELLLMLIPPEQQTAERPPAPAWNIGIDGNGYYSALMVPMTVSKLWENSPRLSAKPGRP